MTESYNSLCDTFYTNTILGTGLTMPSDRGTLVSFFERMQKSFPGLTHFVQRDRAGDPMLREDPDTGTYRWLSKGANVLASGYVGPSDPQAGHDFSHAVLEAAPYYLSISPVDMEYLEIAWGFEFRCKANHHEIIADALFGETTLGQLLAISNSKAIAFGVSLAVSVSADTRTQFRVAVQPRTTVPQIRTGQFVEEPLTVIGILRQWPGQKPRRDLHEIHQHLVEIGTPLIEERLVGPIVTPIRQAIARRI
jgi:hypothetical protein